MPSSNIPRRTHQRRNVVLLCLGITILLWPERNRAGRPSNTTHLGEVHGYVASEIGRSKKTIRIPNASVYLKSTLDGKVASRTTTDAGGRYALRPPSAGKYQICMEAPGFKSSCEPKSITIDQGVVIGPKENLIEALPGVVQGTILLKSGEPCVSAATYFGPEQAAVISLADDNGRSLGQAHSNQLGQYVLAGVPGAGVYHLKTSCTGFEQTEKITLAAADLAGENQTNVTLANSAPQILEILPYVSGKAVRHAAPGSTVEVRVKAMDPDNDKLQFSWGDGSGKPHVSTSPVFTWTLPDSKGANMLFVQVSDGKGGFANSRVIVSTDKPVAFFYGSLVDAELKWGIDGALLDVNGVGVTTENGHFAVAVPEAGRYILTARKIGYPVLSKIFNDSAPSLHVEWQKSEITQVSVAQEVLAFADRPNMPQIRVRPGALVDRDGKAVTGLSIVRIHKYEMGRPDAIPGNRTSVDAQGNHQLVVPLGAVSIEVTDESGKTATLGPNQEALVSIPVDKTLAVGDLPKEVKLWRYNEASGYYEEKGTASLQGNRYVARLTSFSTFLVGLLFTPSDACIQVINNSNIPLPFELQYSVPSPFPFFAPFTATQAIAGQYSILPNLPEYTNVAVSFPGGLRVFGISGNFLNVSSGGSAGPSPEYPFSTCQGSVTFTNPAVGVEFGPFQSPAWLFVPNGIGSPSESLNYYNTILPLVNSTPATETLTAFRNRNQFGPGNDVVAYYYNAADLGLGREMHCAAGAGANRACYVTNYGVSAQTPPPAADAQSAVFDAIVGNTPFATVAMESYPGTTQPVRFYVYGADEKLFLDSNGQGHAVALDGDPTPKYAPHLCLTCHGGYYNSGTISGASFLPFDVYSFVYSDIIFLSFGSNFTYLRPFPHPNLFVRTYHLNDQQGAFRRLNQIVKETNPNSTNPNNPIGNYIDALYSPNGVTNPSSIAQDCFVGVPPDAGTPSFPCLIPSGWNIQGTVFPILDLYNTVVRPQCRMCHNTLPSQFANQDWTDYFSFISNCGFIANDLDNHRMPQAQVPYLRFWLSPPGFYGPTRPRDILPQFCPGAP
jgi:Carboxypeptidase regulatory-like domain